MKGRGWSGYCVYRLKCKQREREDLVFYQQDVLLVALGDGADGDGGELGLLLVHNVRRHVGGLARKLLKALVHLQAR